MSDYNELLNAAIEHLQGLKRQGTRYLSIDREQWANFLKGNAAPPSTKPAASPVKAITPAQTIAKVEQAKPIAWTPIPVAAPTLMAPSDYKNLSATEKTKAWEELRARAMVCQKCPSLAGSRKNVVFGVGSPEADLMFVGEAPGADEDIQGEPFVGRAGGLLTKIIEVMGLSREKVYIANILKCRPDTPGQAYGNRPPTAKEMENCLPYLHAQIDLVQPKMIVALGATAVSGLFGPVGSITRARGKLREYRGIPVMPTYHPSYLLRPNVNNVKREVWEDMMKVMEFLGMPISEKQRNYFLTKSPSAPPQE